MLVVRAPLDRFLEAERRQSVSTLHSMDPRFRLAIPSVLLKTLMSLLLTLINIGSSAASNAVLSHVVSGFPNSYVLPIPSSSFTASIAAVPRNSVRVLKICLMACANSRCSLLREWFRPCSSVFGPRLYQLHWKQQIEVGFFTGRRCFSRRVVISIPSRMLQFASSAACSDNVVYRNR